MFLVDTSAWIAHFRVQEHFDLRQICLPEHRVLCLPVYQEILQGIRDEAAYRELREILDAAQVVGDPMDRGVFLEAASLYRAARRQGLTIRSTVDCQVAALAVRHNLIVVHRDRDYAALAKVSPLREQAI